ncbi:nucleotidyltransferase family protein [Sphingomonas sp. 1P08PE]|uniref:nucleotidyltransferase family protein n=1 Tax=Sphingomonas sp. 1P08PE TaxID=554122 RepID=UPI0039A3DF98
MIGPADRQALRHVLAAFADRIDSVALFGSRATGRARPNSDIDIVIYGMLDQAAVDRLWSLLEDSALSVSVDIVAYGDGVYPPLRQHIDRTARPLFSRAELQAA